MTSKIMQASSHCVPEPFVCSPDETREVPFNILNVVELGRKRVQHVYNENLPIRLALVQECHNAEDLHLLHLTDVCDLLADLADIERVVITLCLRLSVCNVRVFPGLNNGHVYYFPLGQI